ncbi:hypothetical protein MTR_6g010930 [Medicago truncatula]|uniref:Uncharacterized protein n=1 Tax=Medicago truncatula TaxID=3880 RepID=G7KKG0_MEDTR|nr:hypothetical protein MTR_6g010930 [Medicago truncatula]
MNCILSKQLALEVHQLAQGNRKKAKWFRPKVFNDPTTLTEDDLYDLRNQWAT